MSDTTNLSSDYYTENYKEQVFYLWYEGARKLSPKFASSLPLDENGKRPTFKTIEKWRDGDGWIARADALDAEISREFQNKVIDKRVRMYEEHAEIANALITKAKEYLLTHEITRMEDALKAINLGVEIEKTSVGQADLGRRLMSMSGEQLTKELNKILGSGKDDDIIDSSFEEEE